jgi:hypothetical protein
MNIANSSAAPLDASAGVPRYSPAQIALHWVIGLAIIVMLGIGLYMVGLPKGLAFKASLINFHKSLGMTVFLLVLIRIVVRVVAGRPPLPPMPATPCREHDARSFICGDDRHAADGLPRLILQQVQHAFLGHPAANVGLGRPRLAKDFLHGAHGECLGVDRADRAACGRCAQTSVDRSRPSDGTDAAMTLLHASIAQLFRNPY